MNNQTGGISNEIKALFQKEIKIAGFIVPLELGDDMEKLSEFIGEVLAIPGHLDLQVDYKTDDPNAKHALETFAGAVPTIDQVAFDLQAHVDNRIMFNAIISRLGQAIVGEMSLEEAWERMDEDVEKQLKEKYGG